MLQVKYSEMRVPGGPGQLSHLEVVDDAFAVEEIVGYHKEIPLGTVS